MIQAMGKRLMMYCAAAAGAALWALPVRVWAAMDDSGVRPEGRLMGYPTAVKLPDSGSYSLQWLLLFFLALMVVGVVFKDPKRSHLD
jgi:cytochrome oxidase assembly protein ShyY1